MAVRLQSVWRHALRGAHSRHSSSLVSTSSSSTLDGAFYITLNNPRRRNALSLEVLQSLDDIISRAIDYDEVNVVVIRSACPGVFSSGHDLSELQSMSRAEHEQLFNLCSNVMIRIETSPKPFIAEVDGIATAAGCQLVASCDLAVCTSSSKFATPGVNLGLFCSTPAVPLMRSMTRKHAMEMLLTGEFITATRAREMGLVNFVVANNDEIDDTVRSLARRISSRSTAAIRHGKNGLERWNGLENIRDIYAVASMTMVEDMQRDDASEGFSAFFEKREPKWGKKTW